jgi:hypothetical protein
MKDKIKVINQLLSRGYIEEFKTVEDVIERYKAPSDALDDAIVYLAWYGYGSYSGRSKVIYEKNDVLYEVDGSHCSCSGLEGQWDPQKVTWETLSKYSLGGEYDGSHEANALLHELCEMNLKR